MVVAAASAFVVGGLWYGPIFGKAWMAEMGFTEDDYVRLMTESEQRKEAERDLKKRTEQASGRVITICER